MLEALFGVFGAMFVWLFVNVWRIHDTLQEILREIKEKNNYRD